MMPIERCELLYGQEEQESGWRLFRTGEYHSENDEYHDEMVVIWYGYMAFQNVSN
jgi:hypothetical protein